ncbi:hypothetical protein GOODEAATRI_007499 [Goodea atripinnis]|uniref:B30.2/SPRY domain-containing protein n=1 Tax=Goodea atripinnis TaxID=208336 RepID=A0ABV0P2C2_9TELE
MIDAGQQYWEVKFDKESKAFAVGVALRSLGRFDQLGKSSASWCIHLNNWLQQSLTAKYNNKARTLDCPIPNSIGVYVNYDEGLEREFLRGDGPAGSQCGPERPEEEQRHQQLQRQPHLDAPAHPAGPFPAPSGFSYCCRSYPLHLPWRKTRSRRVTSLNLGCFCVA